MPVGMGSRSDYISLESKAYKPERGTNVQTAVARSPPDHRTTQDPQSLSRRADLVIAPEFNNSLDIADDDSSDGDFDRRPATAKRLRSVKKGILTPQSGTKRAKYDGSLMSRMMAPQASAVRVNSDESWSEEDDKLIDTPTRSTTRREGSAISISLNEKRNQGPDDRSLWSRMMAPQRGAVRINFDESEDEKHDTHDTTPTLSAAYGREKRGAAETTERSVAVRGKDLKERSTRRLPKHPTAVGVAQKTSSRRGQLNPRGHSHGQKRQHQLQEPGAPYNPNAIKGRRTPPNSEPVEGVYLDLVEATEAQALRAALPISFISTAQSALGWNASQPSILYRASRDALLSRSLPASSSPLHSSTHPRVISTHTAPPTARQGSDPIYALAREKKVLGQRSVNFAARSIGRDRVGAAGGGGGSEGSLLLGDKEIESVVDGDDDEDGL